MKTQKSVQDSADARLVQCQKALIAASKLACNGGNPSNDDMRHLRRLIGEASQCFHEFSAYRNVLKTT